MWYPNSNGFNTQQYPYYDYAAGPPYNNLGSNGYQHASGVRRPPDDNIDPGFSRSHPQEDYGVMDLVMRPGMSGEQNKVFSRNAGGSRRVILATNIAESSITVVDVKYVIDCCMSKQLQSDTTSSFCALKLTWASKSNCRQRKGRAGRVSNGLCIRLVPRSFYNSLPDFESPEMVRTPLLNIILQTKLLEMGDPWEILRNVISPPLHESVSVNILKLFELGALTAPCSMQNNNIKDGTLTILGYIMALLPIPVHLSKLILLGHAFGLLEDAVIIAATSSARQMFHHGYRNMLSRIRQKRFWANGTNSEMISMANAFKCFLTFVERTPTANNMSKARKFAREYDLNYSGLLAAFSVYKDILKRLADCGIYPHTSHAAKQQQKQQQQENCTTTDDTASSEEVIDNLLIKVAIAGACYPNYFIKNPVDEDDTFKRMRGYHPCQTLKLDLPATRRHTKSKIIESLQRALMTDFAMSNVSVLDEDGGGCVFIKFTGEINRNPDRINCEEKFDRLSRLIADGLIKPIVNDDLIALSSMYRLTLRLSSYRGLVGVNMKKSETTISERRVLIVKVLSFGRFLAKHDHHYHVKEEAKDDDDDVLEYEMAAIRPTDDVIRKDFEEFLPADGKVIVQLLEEEDLSVGQRSTRSNVKKVEVFIEKKHDMRRTKLSDLLIDMYPGVEDKNFQKNQVIQIGPFRSNLRVTFRTLFSTAPVASHVRIQTTDLNGHMLDCEGGIDFDRLLVANEIRFHDSKRNSDGCENHKSLCLFNTTEMPPIIGLPLMMVLVFSPVCQLHVDFFRSMYVSALAGLGPWPDDPNNTSILPSHDLAIGCNAMINRTDLAIMNRIRSYLKSCLYEPYVFDSLNEHMQYSRYRESFEKAREPLRKLFNGLLLKRNHVAYLNDGMQNESFTWRSQQQQEQEEEKEQEQPQMQEQQNKTMMKQRKLCLFGPINAHELDQEPLKNPDYVAYLMRQNFDMNQIAKSNRASLARFCELCWAKLKDKFEITQHVNSPLHQENDKMLMQYAFKKEHSSEN